MQDYSTLIYFVNNFQDDLVSIPAKAIDYNLEDSITKMVFEPSERSVKNILEFARSYDVLETESTGYVEMILN